MHHALGRSRALRLPPLARAALALTCLALPLVTLAARPSGATPTAHDFTAPIFSADARGDIVTIGNVTTTCDPSYHNDRWTAAASAAACQGALDGSTDVRRYDGTPMPPINNRVSMTYVDTDDDQATFASSSAELSLPPGASVLWAGLHWNAATEVPEADQLDGSSYRRAPVDAARRFEVGFRTPRASGYRHLRASSGDEPHSDTWDDTNPGGTVSYAGFVDVTDLVREGGPGDYAVSDVQSCQGFGGCFGSWSLTVAFAAADQPARNLDVWHGWQLTTPTVNHGEQQFTVEGVTPPPSGPVSARIGVVQADGDRGLGPDSLDITSAGAGGAWHPFASIDRPLNPSEGDWFNSTVNGFGRRRPAADASPNLLANLNQDIALVEDHQTIHNTDTGFSFRTRTAGTESLYSQVVHSAVDLYEPTIALTKAVEPTGPVATGQVVTWTLGVDNAGIDPIRHSVVTDPLPAGLTFVPGSIRFSGGGPASILGPKSDGAGDDQAEYDPAHRALAFRVGADADATEGGTMGIAPADDGSDHLTITYQTRVDAPPDTTMANVASAHGEGRALADGFGPTVTDAQARAAIATEPVADLGIDKTDGGAQIRAVGDRFTYTLTATNAGPSAATGVTMTDDLDPLLRFVDSDDGCTAQGAHVACPVGDLASSATATRSFVVEVLHLPGAGQTIPNVARITGDQPNPDCSPPTPHARCNQAGVETPQATIDLGIDKTDDGAVIHAVGDRYRYRFTVTNAGPDTATHVRVVDELDRRLGFAGSDDCSASGRRLTCELGDLGPGESVQATVEVRVLALPEPGRAIPNLATVQADEPDPDCGPTTPTARCNEDTERTPRPLSPAAPTARPAAAPPAPHPAPRRGTLARTGADLAWVAAIGLTACAAGALVLRERARRRTDPWRPPRHSRG